MSNSAGSLRDVASPLPVAPGPFGGLTRRSLLRGGGAGLAGIALAWMMAAEGRCGPVEGGVPEPGSRGSVRWPMGGLHFPARAKRVLHVFSVGGVSHVDTFDYKPALERLHGTELTGRELSVGFFGQPGRLMKSPFEFRQHGRSGAWVSSIFPHLAGCVDDIAFIHSMVARSNNHTTAANQMNSGFTMHGFPCMGSWVSYGLGSMREELPTFVVLPDPRGLPAGGSVNWTAGFLPARHQGIALRTDGGELIPSLSTPPIVPPSARAAAFARLRALNERHLAAHEGDTTLEARIRSYELAAQMQLAVPETVELSSETGETRRLYGLEAEASAGMGRSFLLARRLLERGVRFVQVFNGGAFGSPRINWDAHEGVPENHGKMAATLDRPLSGLLIDLKRRGMLEDTLVVWTTEFGRMPITQGVGATGRDHHPDAFTCFLAGAGVNKGVRHGSTDEVGYGVAESPVSVYDLHATILHLLGIDHERLTFYHNGINRRLTDVHGEVVRGLLA